MTHICKKCNSNFKTMKIDGQWRSASKRKFCWDCSPFGSHNTRDLTHIKNETFTHKKCLTCGILKTLEEFYSAKRRNGKIRTFSYCISCEKDRQFNKMRYFKLKCLEYKGTLSCVSCGYNKCLSALDFHHLDKTTKSDSINSIKRNRDWSVVTKELDKCIVLCANCHREVHYEMER